MLILSCLINSSPYKNKLKDELSIKNFSFLSYSHWNLKFFKQIIGHGKTTFKKCGGRLYLNCWWVGLWVWGTEIKTKSVQWAHKWRLSVGTWKNGIRYADTWNTDEHVNLPPYQLVHLLAAMSSSRSDTSSSPCLCVVLFSKPLNPF